MRILLRLYLRNKPHLLLGYLLISLVKYDVVGKLYLPYVSKWLMFKLILQHNIQTCL